MKSLPGERKLKESRVKFFETHLKQQTFNSPSWSVALIEGEPEEYRADGQHTSFALANFPDEPPKDLNVTINTYHLDSLEDAPDLFDLFDNPMSARSNLDKMGVYTAEHPELANLDSGFLSKITKGLEFYYHDLPADSPKRQGVKLYTAREHGLYWIEPTHIRFALWTDTLSQAGSVKRVGPDSKKAARHAWMLSKPGLVAEMYEDWLSAPQIAQAFWQEVLTENNPDPESETRELSIKFKQWTTKKNYKQMHFRREARKVWSRYQKLAQITAPDTVSAAP